MYAIFISGGKQYRVKKGDTIRTELLPNVQLGQKADFKEVLLVGEGGNVKIGQPIVSSASVNAEVVAIEKGDKIIAYHKKRRKQFDRKVGHRQLYTRLLITAVDNGSGEKDLLSDAEKKTILGNVGFAQVDARLAPAAEEHHDTAPEAKKASAGPAKKAVAKKKAPAKKAAAGKAKKTAKKK